MPNISLTRRRVVQGLASASLASPLLGRIAWAAAPAPSKVTPELIEAAKKEGKVVWYTAVDLPVAERIAKAFEAKYPGIAVRVERSGGERIFQRIGQEYASNIHAVDVVNSSDAAHFIVWKRDGILAPYVPEDVATALSGRAQGPRRAVRQLAHLAVRDRLQHQAGEGGGGAQELRRPARSQVGRQDRQGASRLQRHHHDRHLPDVARHRLGLLREARRSRRSCRCSRAPIRPRSWRSASAPSWPTATSTI